MHTNALVKAAGALSCLLLSSSLLAQQEKPLPAPAAREMTLREFRNIFLNQRILILKGQDVGGSLGGWQPVKMAKNGAFTDDYNKGAFINLKYREETPAPSSIRENTVTGMEKATEGTANAFGETITDADIVNRSVEVIVHFDDGQLAKFTSIVSLIMDGSAHEAGPYNTDHLDMEFMPVSTRDAHAEVVKQNLQGTIGQKVFAVHSTLLSGADISPTDLTDFSRRIERRVDDVPLLTPMTIVAAKYIDRYDLMLWKLQLDNGLSCHWRIEVSRRRCQRKRQRQLILGAKQWNIFFVNPIEPNGTRDCRNQGQEDFPWYVSTSGLLILWGATTENDYGKGGKQLVYGDNQFVYLDNNGSVIDWQSVGKIASTAILLPESELVALRKTIFKCLTCPTNRCQRTSEATFRIPETIMRQDCR